MTCLTCGRRMRHESEDCFCSPSERDIRYLCSKFETQLVIAYKSLVSISERTGGFEIPDGWKEELLKYCNDSSKNAIAAMERLDEIK